MAVRITSEDELKRLVETLPFQSIADTPTVRYYTKWEVYKEYMGMDYAAKEDQLPEQLNKVIEDARTIVLGKELRAAKMPEGVNVEDLGREGVSTSNGRLKPFSLVRYDTGKMQAYHALRYNQGVGIYIDRGTDFGKIAIVSLGGDGYLGHHIVLEVGDGARGEILFIDYHGSRGLKTLVFESSIGASAEVEFTNIALHSKESAVYTLREIYIGEKASITQSYLLSGGRMTRFQDDNILEGRLSKLEARASSVARPSTSSDIILSSLHHGAESEGDVRARGVVVGNGYLAQRGVAMLGETAKLAASEVESYIFLLSENGKGYAVPVLEIHTGDIIRAGHSAAVASLAEDTVFYLRSRGLSEKEIVKLVMEGIGRFSGVIEKTGIDFGWLVDFH
ncbi:MAG: SufD family Fe-S cluster assembly protein [Aeropyrum sp.]|nr:SufD family Fe-S cluster assembly protein [Aeropyrum sp.]